MSTRFAALCAVALLIFATAQAQQGPPPGQEGPPSVEFPPPKIEGAPPPGKDRDDPPPRVEGAPPPRDDQPPRAEGKPPRDDDLPVRPKDDPPPRADGQPPRDDAPPPRADGQPPRDDAPPRADRQLDTANRCGAVAYTADGAFGASYGMENCDEAERLAVDECRREAVDKADCSRGVIVRRDSWFYIQFCRRGRDWMTNITTRQTLSDTNRAAQEWARGSQYGLDNCRMVPNGLLHSGGLHTKM